MRQHNRLQARHIMPTVSQRSGPAAEAAGSKPSAGTRDDPARKRRAGYVETSLDLPQSSQRRVMLPGVARSVRTVGRPTSC